MKKSNKAVLIHNRFCQIFLSEVCDLLSKKFEKNPFTAYQAIVIHGITSSVINQTVYQFFACSLCFSKLFCLVGALKADSKTIIVPDDYTDIQEAINNANPVDTVHVKKGTHYHEGAIYGERAFAYIINKSISLVGEDSKTTILKPQYTHKNRLRSV